MSSSAPPHVVAWNSLRFLNFETAKLQSKHSMQFNAEMLLVPNIRAFQVIYHFLFTKLDKSKAGRVFATCWPSFDKHQESEFRKACLNWFDEFVDKQTILVFPKASQSLFLTPGGRQYARFTAIFATYVLSVVSQRENGLAAANIPRAPKMTARVVEYRRAMKENLLAGLDAKMNDIAEEAIYSAESVEAKVKKQFDESNTQYRNVSRKVDALREKRREQKKSKEDGAKARLAGILESITQLNEALAASLKKQDVLKRIFDNDGVYSVLNGDELNVVIPSDLQQKYAVERLDSYMSNIYKTGKLDLVSLLKFACVALHSFIDDIQRIDYEGFLTMKASGFLRMQLCWLNVVEERHAASKKTIIKLRQQIRDHVDRLTNAIKNESEFKKKRKSILPQNTDAKAPPAPTKINFGLVAAAEGDVEEEVLDLADFENVEPEMSPIASSPTKIDISVHSYYERQPTAENNLPRLMDEERMSLLSFEDEDDF